MGILSFIPKLIPRAAPRFIPGAVPTAARPIAHFGGVVRAPLRFTGRQAAGVGAGAGLAAALGFGGSTALSEGGILGALGLGGSDPGSSDAAGSIAGMATIAILLALLGGAYILAKGKRRR